MILFALPVSYLIAIYVIAAVGPAVFLMRYIYRHDTTDREPPALLLALVGRGILAALAAAALEMLGEALLPNFVDPNSPDYTYYFAFLVVAAAEEGAKFFFLYRRTWHDPNFNCRFDGIVYAAFVSLGFAAFENVQYVFRYGLSVALPRAVLAVPGHMGFAVFMGVFYGRAKRSEALGHGLRCKVQLLLGYLAAVFLHGVYDSCCMVGTGESTAIFIAFVAVMYFIVIRTVQRESRTDQYIP